MRKIDRQRMKLLERIEKRSLIIFDNLENQFLRAIIKELESILIINEGKVLSTTKNFVNLNKLGIFQETFRKRNILPVASWIASALISVTRMNNKYFSEQFSIDSIKGKVEAESLAQYGIRKDSNKIRISKNSFLDQISRFENPYLGVRNITTQAIAQGMKLSELKNLIRTEIKPEGKYGKIKHHFHTISNDLFTQHDRKIQKSYADKLNLRAFIYNGGVVSTSRDFCEQRNGKVFTREEAEEWRGINWEGKPTIYNPLVDLGGYNCRHFTGWINEKEAVRRRPELKSYFENLD